MRFWNCVSSRWTRPDQAQGPGIRECPVISNQALRVRKRLLGGRDASSAVCPSSEIDLLACATILYSSEDSDHPIDLLFDGRSGRGATHWSSERESTIEEIVLEFDQPVYVTRVVFDAEEREAERTQQVTMEFSSDGGKTYRGGLVQEYTFSPNGATYQREELSFNPRTVTHLRFIVTPNKGGAGRASLTSLRLFG